MPGREPWERYSGDEIEAVVAIMLLREFPHGRRIRPSQGDGGVDVLVPHGARRWEVYQVKGFTTALSSSHKRQIGNSWRRLRKFTDDRNIEVAAWHVVRPIDPTHEDDAWLQELTRNSGIPSDWTGLATIDGWAARYPDVTDYYLHGGRDEVLEQARLFLQAAQVDQSLESGRLVEPIRAVQGLLSWSRALNSIDPHFRYYMHTMATPANGEFVVPPPTPGLLMSMMISDGDDAARLDVIARYDEATKDRPAPLLRVRLQPETGAEREALEDFLAYGISLTNMPAQVTSVELPVGDDLREAVARVSLWPTADNAKPRRVDLAITHDQMITVMPLMLQAPTRGGDGSNRWAWSGADSTGLVSIELRHDPTGLNSLRILASDISGRLPRDVVSAFAPLMSMRTGAELEFRVPDGPFMLKFALQEDAVDVDQVRHRLDVAEDLLTLQGRIPQQVLVPEVPTITEHDLQSWHDAAILLRGGTVQRIWASLGMTRHRTGDLLMPRQIRVTRPLTITIGRQEWILGLVGA